MQTLGLEVSTPEELIAPEELTTTSNTAKALSEKKAHDDKVFEELLDYFMTNYFHKEAK
jgi:chaperone required for assembly of F1-ATPase